MELLNVDELFELRFEVLVAVVVAVAGTDARVAVDSGQVPAD